MKKLSGILTIILSLLSLQVISGNAWDEFITFDSATTQDGPSQGQFVSTSSGLDAPKVHPINGTAYDWWYFDAVSADAKSSFVIVFYTASQRGLPFAAENTTVVSLTLDAKFPNGTIYSISLPATSATIVSIGNGTTGLFKGSHSSWTSTPDLSQYIVSIDDPSAGIKGTFKLNSLAPGHYPCGTGAGESMEIMPNVGWANAVPDAHSTVNFVINGSKLDFTGPGYHDKNWGVVPFAENVGSWYWGHGRLGPYSIVWYDALSPTGAEFVSAYVGYQGKIISSQCSGIQVRPRGANSTYPPVQTSGNPAGFHIGIDLGNSDILEVDVSRQCTTVDSPAYKRWTGLLKGGRHGSQVFEGVALYEQFALKP